MLAVNRTWAREFGECKLHEGSDRGAADGKPFAFAGLWEPKTIAETGTFTILTCEPNELCAQVHDRMPVILAPDAWSAWLATPENRFALIKPFPATDMTMWPVSTAVGNVKNTGPELIEEQKAG
jgi:putative SOS response-associated peptidase YedK